MWGKPAACGWGCGKGAEKGGKGMEKGGKANPLKEIDNSLKVWVGNLADNVTWKELQTHFEQAGKVRWTEVMRKGMACVAYNSVEDVATAIAMLNGTSLANQEIQADAWEAKPKSEDSGKGQKAWGGNDEGKAGKGWSVATPMFVKPDWSGKGSWSGGKEQGKGGKKGGWGKDSMLKRIDPTLKVWVGGVPADTQWKDLEAHFKQAGETTWVEVMRSGTACVAYKTVAEVEMAIATLNASEFGGQVLEVDVWTQGGGKGAKATS